MRKIDLYVNGKYVCSSTRYKRCKDFVLHARSIQTLEVASAPNFWVRITPLDKVTARFSKSN